MNGTYTQRRTTQRQNYGLGDLVKKVGERFRKLIPNEIANVAAKAAPFVAPFNPLAAGIMRGVGRYDKRGDFGDALKQGLLTYGGGQAARYLGGAGMQTGIDPRGGMGGGMMGDMGGGNFGGNDDHSGGGNFGGSSGNFGGSSGNYSGN